MLYIANVLHLNLNIRKSTQPLIDSDLLFKENLMVQKLISDTQVIYLASQISCLDACAYDTHNH